MFFDRIAGISLKVDAFIQSNSGELLAKSATLYVGKSPLPRVFPMSELRFFGRLATFLSIRLKNKSMKSLQNVRCLK